MEERDESGGHKYEEHDIDDGSHKNGADVSWAVKNAAGTMQTQGERV